MKEKKILLAQVFILGFVVSCGIPVLMQNISLNSCSASLFAKLLRKKERKHPIRACLYVVLIRYLYTVITLVYCSIVLIVIHKHLDDSDISQTVENVPL